MHYSFVKVCPQNVCRSLVCFAFKDFFASDLSYLWYDPCRPTSTCSWRWPYKIPVRILDSTVHCVSYLTSINNVMYASQASLADRSSCNRHWSWVYFIIVVRGITGIKPEALLPLLLRSFHLFSDKIVVF